MGTDLTKENIQNAPPAKRGQGNVQDLYGLDAVIPLDAASGPRAREGGKQDGPSHTAVQPSSSVKRIEQHLTVVPLDRPRAPAAPAEAAVLMSFPQQRTKPEFGTFIWFVLCVLLPIAAASVYYGYFATNQYVAEFRFTVRDATTPSTQSVGGLMSLIGGSGGSTINDNYIVTDFLTSRQAVDELQTLINVVGLYSKPEIDWWSRFDKSLPIETFVKYWRQMVTARFDIVTGIATVEVRAFSPQDSLLIANKMVGLSEKLVNGISSRSYKDAVSFAQRELEAAQGRLKTVRGQLTAYRNKYGLIDPGTSVVASNATLIQSQRANLAQLETQLLVLQSQRLLPNAPAIVTLKNQIKSTREQLARTEAEVGQGNSESSATALSAIVGNYEQLNLEVQFAQAMVTSTMQALEQARANAAAQHLYITPYVWPTLPQSSTYPQRYFAVAMVGVMAFTFWLIGLMIVRSIRERFG